MDCKYTAVVYLTQSVNKMTQIYCTAQFRFKWVALVWCYLNVLSVNYLVKRGLVNVEIEITDNTNG